MVQTDVVALAIKHPENGPFPEVHESLVLRKTGEYNKFDYSTEGVYYYTWVQAHVENGKKHYDYRKRQGENIYDRIWFTWNANDTISVLEVLLSDASDDPNGCHIVSADSTKLVDDIANWSEIVNYNIK